MKVFNTYLYEVSKGAKPVALITCDVFLCIKMIQRLEKQNINFVVQKVSDDKTNLFFGAKECIDVLKKLISKPLSALSVEEDFVLGTILGYDVKIQCKRFLEKCA